MPGPLREGGCWRLTIAAQLTRSRCRAGFLAGGALLAGALAAVAPMTAVPAAPSVPPAVPPVVVLPDAARTPSLSADGRLLVYAAAPADDDGRTSSIWLLDRSTGTTTELTRPLEGLR